jgi:pyruvate/2-oxoglutarate dehydrogenase complex dihydrolipoamide dehydrogenase (E3) component
VGASYVALECAGFLNGVKLDVTVMVRSIVLRGFDQQIAEQIKAYMAKEGVNFIDGKVPTKLEKAENGRIRVSCFRCVLLGFVRFSLVLQRLIGCSCGWVCTHVCVSV